ncbi:hypothetical protein WJX77_007938 [Trebouxia sp. C0004]
MSSVGASGLCFGLQVVADYTRQGSASVMNLLVPVRFSCGSNLVVTQALLSCDHTSFKGHLSSTMAGLVHVFLPKAVETAVQSQQRSEAPSTTASAMAQLALTTHKVTVSPC